MQDFCPLQIKITQSSGGFPFSINEALLGAGEWGREGEGTYVPRLAVKAISLSVFILSLQLSLVAISSSPLSLFQGLVTCQRFNRHL